MRYRRGGYDRCCKHISLLGLKAKRKPSARCDVPNCSKLRRSRTTKCAVHARAMESAYSPLLCSIYGCAKQKSKKGLCHSHFLTLPSASQMSVSEIPQPTQRKCVDVSVGSEDLTILHKVCRLAEEDEQRMLYTLSSYRNWRRVYSNELLGDHGIDVDLTPIELNKLVSGRQIETSLINMWMFLLAQQFSSFKFYPVHQCSEELPNTLSDSQRPILIPIILRTLKPNHFILLYAHGGVLHLLNSHESAFKAAKEYATKACKKVGLQSMKVIATPEQTNTRDCGVFVCLNAYEICCERLPIRYPTHSLTTRKWMTHKLMRTMMLD